MKGSKREFSEKEIEWLKRHFRNTKNEELARKLGCSQTALHRLAVFRSDAESHAGWDKKGVSAALSE